MKKACFFLLLILFATYIKEGYKLVTIETPVKSFVQGSLSDIAEEVIAIPLETNTHCLLSQAKQIRRDGNDLFLVCKQQLYHFDCSGKFINQITHTDQACENNIAIKEYVIDPLHKQLVVIDNQQNIHYYNYQGELKSKTNLAGNQLWSSLIKLSYYDYHIWVTAERQIHREEYDNKLCLEQWLYKLDTNFHEVESRKLTPAGVGRFSLDRGVDPEILVANKNVYVHAPSSNPDQLLRDTLYLISRNTFDITDGYSSILPLRIGSRYLLSTYYNASAINKSYTFCFDQKENQAYNVQGGFEDNFYHTGQVPELQAMDVYSNSYCYYKTGEEVKQAFPGRKDSDNPVLFIVKLKA